MRRAAWTFTGYRSEQRLNDSLKLAKAPPSLLSERLLFSGAVVMAPKNYADGSSFGVQIAELDPVGGNQWSSMPGEQHNQGGDLAFADGHAQRFRWRWSRKVAYPAPIYTQPASAADWSDWQRLADATPR
jgi:prepilin-type processing-associated H-X9-DG protein